MTSQDILAKYEQSYAQARQANEERYQQGMGILDQAIERYQPGGGFGEGAMAQYEQGKTQAMAQGMQSLVNSGLSNTTISATLPLAYEQEVGTPFRLQLEDMRMQNLTQAEGAKTSFIEARKDPYPDFGMFAQLAMQAATNPNTQGGRAIDWGGFNTWDTPGLADAFGQNPEPASQDSMADWFSDTGALGGMSSGLDSTGSKLSGNMNPAYTPGGTTGTTSGAGGANTITKDGVTYTMGPDGQLTNQPLTNQPQADPNEVIKWTFGDSSKVHTGTRAELEKQMSRSAHSSNYKIVGSGGTTETKKPIDRTSAYNQVLTPFGY
jgi:hypothetical protein